MEEARQARKPRDREARRRAGKGEEEPAGGSSGLRWLVVWAVLAALYAAATLGYRAVDGRLGIGREDWAHWAAVPLVETAALALVVRLRRKA